MNSNLSKSIVGGIVGAALMSLVMFIAPMMGMPKMSAPDMLSGMMGMPILVGWLMHFIIGIIFALVYTFLFAPNVQISNIYVKGAVFGIAVFILAQLMMALMPMPMQEGSKMLMIMGSLIGHVIFGMGVSKTVNQ